MSRGIGTSPKPVSANMIAQLRWIDAHDVPVDYLGHMNQTTLGANLGPARRYLKREGGWLRLTEDGKEVVSRYLRITEVGRKHPGNMTERVAAMVRYARIKKSQGRSENRSGKRAA